MKVLLLLTCALLGSLAFQSNPGCAFYEHPAVGKCDKDNSECSYGCYMGLCWKQCQNDEDQCDINERKWCWAENKNNGNSIKCQQDEDCLEDIDFGTSSFCRYGDPTVDKLNYY